VAGTDPKNIAMAQFAFVKTNVEKLTWFNSFLQSTLSLVICAEVGISIAAISLVLGLKYG
jgi:hypothetical protein